MTVTGLLSSIALDTERKREAGADHTVDSIGLLDSWLSGYDRSVPVYLSDQVRPRSGTGSANAQPPAMATIPQQSVPVLRRLIDLSSSMGHQRDLRWCTCHSMRMMK